MHLASCKPTGAIRWAFLPLRIEEIVIIAMEENKKTSFPISSQEKNNDFRK